MKSRKLSSEKSRTVWLSKGKWRLSNYNWRSSRKSTSNSTRKNKGWKRNTGLSFKKKKSCWHSLNNSSQEQKNLGTSWPQRRKASRNWLSIWTSWKKERGHLVMGRVTSFWFRTSSADPRSAATTQPVPGTSSKTTAATRTTRKCWTQTNWTTTTVRRKTQTNWTTEKEGRRRETQRKRISHQ